MLLVMSFLVKYLLERPSYRKLVALKQASQRMPAKMGLICSSPSDRTNPAIL